MARLSKEERKRLRREAEQSERTEEYFSHIVSNTATQTQASPKSIVEQAAAVGVALEHRPIDDTTHAFGIPGEDNQFVTAIGYTELSPDLVAQAEYYDWLVDDVGQMQIGLPTITLRARVRLDPVVDFMHMTMLRVLGRLTHGMLISETSRNVVDDWLAWSLDYCDPDMFNVTRVYDEPPPDFRPLIERFPSLRAGSSV